MAMASSENKAWFIYCHTAPNGKRYIGQTRLRPETRWGNGRGYSNQQYFKRAIDKYGWDNFDHAVLCSVSNQEYANFLEQWFIKKWDTTNPERGYNCAEGGSGPKGVKWDEGRKKAFGKLMAGENNPMYGKHHSAETRALMSRNRSGIEQTPEMREFRTNILLEANKKRRIPIRQLDLSGNLIRTYPGMGDAEKETGYSHSSIWKVCRGLAETAYGFRWEYVDEDLRIEAQSTKDSRPKGGTPVIQLDLDGNEVARYESMTAAERETGLNRNKISACCFGDIETYAGHVWKLERPVERKKTGRSPDPVGVALLDMDGTVLASYASMKEAMDATGHDRHRIAECCKGKRESYRGYRWRFADATEPLVKQPASGLFS